MRSKRSGFGSRGGVRKGLGLGRNRRNFDGFGVILRGLFQTFQDLTGFDRRKSGRKGVVWVKKSGCELLLCKIKGLSIKFGHFAKILAKKLLRK